LLDEIEMEMQDNFDEHDGSAGNVVVHAQFNIKTGLVM
jgi:hypothetical protein